MLAQYPQGLQSVDPTIVDKLPNGNVASAIFGAEYSISVDPGDAGASAARAQFQAEITHRLNQISKEMAENPKQALADAKNMPLSGAKDQMLSPRCVALMKVARSTVTKHPDIAVSALQEIRKTLEPMPLLQRGHFLTDATDLYLKLGRNDEAMRTLHETMKTAEMLYDKDTDASDPNLGI